MARESLFDTFARTFCERATRDMPNREAAYLSMLSLFYAQAAAICGGEWIYGPRTNPVELEQSRARIAAAVQAGEEPSAIAARERVHPATVRRIRARIRP